MQLKLEPKEGIKPKVALYIRVTTAEQAELGHSLSVQQNRLDQMAENNGWEVIAAFKDEGKSARTVDRPSFEALLDFCEDSKGKLDAILVQDTSRLCRNVKDHLEVKAFLKKRDIRLISLEGNNEDTAEAEFLDIIVAGVNELESKRTGRKTKRIMQAMFEQGLKPGQAPIGYCNSFKKGEPMYPDPKTSYFIKRAFDLWNTGNYSLQNLSDVLYAEGFRSVNNKKVEKSALQTILTRIEYTGGLKYDGQINLKAKHKAIISMEDFDKAQRVFQLKNRKADRSRKHTTLLSGIVYCAECRNLMHGEYHSNGNYYRCPICGSPYALMEHVDSEMCKLFTKTLFTPKGLQKIEEVLISVQKQQGSKNPALKKSLEVRKKGIEAQMSKLEDKLLFEDNLIDKERIESKYKPLKQELKQIEKQVKELSKPSNNLNDSEIDKIIWGFSQIGKLYKALSDTEKKQFLHYFIKKVYVDCKESKIVNVELVEDFETLISRDFVRISSNWLPRVDSNH